MDLATENASLKRQLMVEMIRRLSAEMQAAKASMAAIQMRIPGIESEMALAQAKLAELTTEEDHGPAGN